MTRAQVEALFELAGFSVLRMKPLIDGYGYEPDDPRYFETLPRAVWWFVKTSHGWIEVGWRKRVVEIDWQETPARLLVTTDDVTKHDSLVHAWSMIKALEYLTALRRALEEPAPLDAVVPADGIVAEPLRAQKERSDV